MFLTSEKLLKIIKDMGKKNEKKKRKEKKVIKYNMSLPKTYLIELD